MFRITVRHGHLLRSCRLSVMLQLSPLRLNFQQQLVEVSESKTVLRVLFQFAVPLFDQVRCQLSIRLFGGLVSHEIPKDGKRLVILLRNSSLQNMGFHLNDLMIRIRQGCKKSVKKICIWLHRQSGYVRGL